MKKTFCFFRMILFALIIANPSLAQWIQTSGPCGGNVLSIAVSGTNIFAGTEGGGIYRSTDNGSSWIQINNGLTNNIVKVLKVSGTNIFAGTIGGGIFRSTNNGINWTQLNIGSPGTTVLSLAAFDSNLFAGIYGYGIFLSTDEGESWTSINSQVTDYSIVSALAISGSSIFAGTQTGVFRSSDYGESWTESGLSGISIISFAVSDSIIIAGTEFAGLFRSNDHGITWVNNDFLNSNFVYALTVSGINIYAGTYGGGVFLSTNDGKNWKQINKGLTNTCIFSLAASGSNIFAGTYYDGLFISTDSGSNWTQSNNGLTSSMVNSMIVSGNNLFAGTKGEGVFRSANNGASWTTVNNGFTNPFRSVNVLAASGSILLAGTFGEGIFRSTDNGEVWAQSDLISETVNALAVSGPNLFAGTYGGVFRSTNGGLHWTKMSSGIPAPSSVIFLAVSGTNLFAVIDASSEIYRSTDNGSSWIQADNGLSGAYVLSLAVAGTDIFAGTDRGGVFYSTDNGETWIHSNYNFNNSPVNSIIASDMNLFAGTSDGNVYLSTDNGTIWNLINTGLSTTHIMALAVTSTNLFAGTMGDGVFRRPLKEIITNPSLISVKDIPFDQGGKVELIWRASSLDTNISNMPYYSIWRALRQSDQSNVALKNSSGKLNFTTSIKRIGSIKSNAETFVWEWLANQPAHKNTLYSYIASTPYDSMSVTNGRVYFMVSAQTSNPNLFYDSNPDSGCSVDNLPPLPPSGLTVLYAPGKVELNWSSHREPDLLGYVVYRSENHISDPDKIARYGATSKPEYIDAYPLIGMPAYYIIRAEDIHYNLSGASNQVSILATGIEDDISGIPSEYSLRQNYPNPFNPSTIIKYQLPVKSRVMLKVYDLLGRQVAVLVNEFQNAGYKSVTFNAGNLPSGIYFCIIEAGTFTETKKLILLR
jgi:photosystem II stability/assembly factor-like uncharacterized protein